ncbi:hypothetical protein [Planctomyces sp. SH-PL62]|uniref:hypothetical protein n=1 Tax=Planctomyces sp. SH-PL62 TaxID=1636152 RepID=UPI00078BA2E9|nr:hypothetical protein [Planctomyces sp. SH-PL62]AMV40889.1 hypothetical protein VT85_25875 [Planctomyces sp. SH-PL62]
MNPDASWLDVFLRSPRRVLLGLSLALAAAPPPPASAAPPESEPGFRFPTVPEEHPHARALLANALRYLGPDNRIFDAESGYPFEGWNQDPARGIFLRSFTQLTAIGQGMEILANVAAGACDAPFLPRREALALLSRQSKNLLVDQADPSLSAEGLLGNFLDLATGKRLGPLTSDVEKAKLAEAVGPGKVDAVWDALVAKGWLMPRKDGGEAEVRRAPGFGWEHFDGPLEPFHDNATKQAIMNVLDERIVMTVFVDNANLSSSVARCLGALARPEIADDPEAVEIRARLERFLEAQREGYARLYDPAAGQFYFGRDVTHDRLFGWNDLEGKWVTGHVDYLVNEFRGPATFIVLRYGLPLDAIANLGFKMKPYRAADGRVRHVLAPWEGSAFQGLGFELTMTELDRPSWRRLLEDFVEVEIDYASRHGLPGFLSESYSGRGTQYTGHIGIPEITVAPDARIIDAPSLYTLGPAYAVAPARVEAFLAASWPVLSTLLTDHGPWEGYNTTAREPILFQTSAHTFSLILGLLGTASDNMAAYLESRGLHEGLEQVFPTGGAVDLLAAPASAFAWDAKTNPIESRRDDQGFRVASPDAHEPGIAFVSEAAEGSNLSGAVLALRYRLTTPASAATITLKPVKAEADPASGRIATELFVALAPTADADAELRVQLPATPGLSRVKEVVLTFGPAAKGKPLDVSIRGLTAAPR